VRGLDEHDALNAGHLMFAALECLRARGGASVLPDSPCAYFWWPGEAGKAAREALHRPRADAVAHPRCGFRLVLRFQSDNFAIFLTILTSNRWCPY